MHRKKVVDSLSDLKYAGIAMKTTGMSEKINFETPLTNIESHGTKVPR